MSEYRQDPVSGQWVIYARERATRPTEFVSAPIRKPFDRCPFCAGNESDTPDPVAVYSANTGDARSLESKTTANAWHVRVVPNRYPAVTTSSNGVELTGSADGMVDGSHLVVPGYGVHDVIIESPAHTTSFSEITSEQALYSFVAYRDRIAKLSHDDRLCYAHVFKNCRGAGGATLDHTHSQLLAMTIVPEGIRRELTSSADHLTRHGSCIFCDTIEHERKEGTRIVAETRRFVAFCPFAGRFPYEMWILPREHQNLFHLAKLADLEELSALIQRIVRGLEKMIPQAAYNYWIHTSPFDTIGYDHYHWHIEFIPRITTQAGFEWGTGCFVNDVLPEDAAIALRGAMGGHSETIR